MNKYVGLRKKMMLLPRKNLSYITRTNIFMNKFRQSNSNYNKSPMISQLRKITFRNMKAKLNKRKSKKKLHGNCTKLNIISKFWIRKMKSSATQNSKSIMLSLKHMKTKCRNWRPSIKKFQVPSCRSSIQKAKSKIMKLS